MLILPPNGRNQTVPLKPAAAASAEKTEQPPRLVDQLSIAGEQTGPATIVVSNHPLGWAGLSLKADPQAPHATLSEVAAELASLGGVKMEPGCLEACPMGPAPELVMNSRGSLAMLEEPPSPLG